MKNKKQEGITLISLAITIIVLLILAGITLNLTLGENGIFKTATDAKEKHKIGELTEKLELQKVPVQTENKGKVTLETYLEQIVKEGIIDESDIQETGEENSRTIIVEDKYVFLVEDEENGDVKITYQGEAGKLLPVLEIEKIETTTSTIKIKVTAKRLNDGEYKYYIKDIETGEEYKLEGTNKTGEYTFEGLTQEHEYQIKIEAINKNGTTSIETGIITTTEVEGLTQANTTFTYNPEGWTNKNVVVTANTTISIPEGYKLQTSKNASDWSDTTSQTFTENGTMYVRLSDGTNGGSYAVAQVSKIDKTAPEVEAITTTKSITITATDEASGIIGYKITTNSTQPTEFTSCTNTKNLNVTIDNLTQGTTYYVWVKDEAGNINTQKQFTTKLVDELTQANTTFTYNPEGWTNKDVVVTANTTISIPEGYKLQTSKDASNWNDIASQTFTENGTMYVRLFDGINGGNYAVAQVSKIDKDIPIVTEVTSTTNSVTIKATDSASGIIGYAVTTNNTQPTEFTSCANTKNLNVTQQELASETTYYVWVKDEAGNVSVEKSIITKKQLATPNITLNGKEGNNNYYVSDVAVTIEDTNSSESNKTELHYTITGASAVNEQVVEATTANISMKKDGESILTVWKEDGEGNISEKETLSVKIDQTPPTNIKFSFVTSSVGASYNGGMIRYKVTCNDATSGINSAEFQKSKTNNSEDFVSDGKSSVYYTSYGFQWTYSGLDTSIIEGVQYYFRAIVEDKAGNVAISPVVDRTTMKKTVNIGQYVDYYPKKIESYEKPKELSGYTTQTFETNENVDWRILEIDKENNKLLLISNMPVHTKFNINSAQGYNNGVALMDDTCDFLYGNDDLGATARNLKIEDIEKQSSYKKENYTYTGGGKYGDNIEVTNAATGWRYPTIFQYEIGACIDGVWGNRYDRSEQKEFIEDGIKTSKASNSLIAKSTYYTYKLSTSYLNSKYLELFAYKEGTTTALSKYWLSSRCVTATKSRPSFRMFAVSGSSITSTTIYASNGSNSGGYAAGLRPVIEIDLSKVNIAIEGGSGSKNNPYSITAKNN